MFFRFVIDLVALIIFGGLGLAFIETITSCKTNTPQNSEPSPKPSKPVIPTTGTLIPRTAPRVRGSVRNIRVHCRSNAVHRNTIILP